MESFAINFRNLGNHECWNTPVVQFWSLQNMRLHRKRTHPFKFYTLLSNTVFLDESWLYRATTTPIVFSTTFVTYKMTVFIESVNIRKDLVIKHFSVQHLPLLMVEALPWHQLATKSGFWCVPLWKMRLVDMGIKLYMF